MQDLHLRFSGKRVLHYLQEGDQVYNRYVPQPDGSYQRNRVAQVHDEAVRQPPDRPRDDKNTQHMNPIENISSTVSASSFIKQLIPKNLDTGDLLVIVLLLLMAGDCKEEKNSALLTLALYLFL